MPPKVLRHCSICKKWGAMHVVQDQNLGKLILCNKCWLDWQKRQAAKQPMEAQKIPAKQPPGSDKSRE